MFSRTEYFVSVVALESLVSAYACVVEIGACIEPLSVAWYAVKRSGFVKGQTALVTGSGPVSKLMLSGIPLTPAPQIGLFLLKVLRYVELLI
jgi:threonine dehydrogenase-like Zn-dependent dehydrogenase